MVRVSITWPLGSKEIKPWVCVEVISCIRLPNARLKAGLEASDSKIQHLRDRFVYFL